MKILITGIGIVGKSTLRRQLVQLFRSLQWPVAHFDADNFITTRHPIDRDCAEPKTFAEGTFYFIEDVHGTGGGAREPLEKYDLIIYVQASLITHSLFLISRGWQWYKNGNYDFDQQTGWKGTAQRSDWRNLIPIVKNCLRILIRRQVWIDQDHSALSKARTIKVLAHWTPDGPEFSLLPTLNKTI
ncbi:TPA: hypothetical protein DF272_02710 [Candidatus Falkowbacteria bacterium]|nr:hypothetical protein [Candidatus Falkowbacteria bacterium]